MIRIVVFLFVMFLAVLFLTTRGEAGFLPPVSNNEITVATLGNLNKNRYKKGFSFEALWYQSQILSTKAKFVSVGYLKHNNSNDHGGGLGGYLITPLNYFLTPGLKDKIFLITGGELESTMRGYLGGGVLLDLERTIIFFKQRGERITRGGVIIPLLNRTMSFGIISEFTNNYNNPFQKDIWKLGLSFSISLTKNIKSIVKDIKVDIQDSFEEIKETKE